MLSHKKSTLATVAAVLLTATGTAYATGVVPNALGGPGAKVPLQTNCMRKPMYIVPAGKVWSGANVDGKKFVFEGFNIYQQQIQCLIHRVDSLEKTKGKAPAPNCFAQVGPPPTETVYHSDDWEANNLADAKKGIDTAGPNGVDASAAWNMALYKCETAPS